MSAADPQRVLFRVRVYDNFHYMDYSASWISGEYATYDEALIRAKRIVVESCKEFGFDMAKYVMFGEDPAIEGAGEEHPLFSARDYAREVCDAHANLHPDSESPPPSQL